MLQLRFFVVLVVAYCWTPTLATNDFTELPNRGIHTFQNRHDGGFLTAIHLKTPAAPIVTDVWRDASTQKWRVVSALLSKSYQLRPISDEDRVMEYDAYQRLVYQDRVGLGLGNSEYWQVVYVGHGYHLLKNYKTAECLEASALGQPVQVRPCTTAPRQQWAIHTL